MLWGLNNDKLERLQEEDGYEAGDAEAWATEAAAQWGVMDALCNEIARLRNDKIRLMQQVEDQDILIAHMMTRQERLKMNGACMPINPLCASHTVGRSNRNHLKQWFHLLRAICST